MRIMKLSLLSLASSLALVAFGFACDRTPGASAAPGPAGSPSGPAAPSAETGAYKVELKPVGTYKKGQAATFEVVLKTKDGYHVNEEYPTKLKLAEAAGVAYAQPILQKMKDPTAFTMEKCASGSDMCTLKITVKFTPEQAGSVKLGGELAVGVCNKETCLVEKKQLDLSVPVT